MLTACVVGGASATSTWSVPATVIYPFGPFTATYHAAVSLTASGNTALLFFVVGAKVYATQIQRTGTGTLRYDTAYQLLSGVSAGFLSAVRLADYDLVLRSMDGGNQYLYRLTVSTAGLITVGAANTVAAAYGTDTGAISTAARGGFGMCVMGTSKVLFTDGKGSSAGGSFVRAASFSGVTATFGAAVACCSPTTITEATNTVHRISDDKAVVNFVSASGITGQQRVMIATLSGTTVTLSAYVSANALSYMSAFDYVSGNYGVLLARNAADTGDAVTPVDVSGAAPVLGSPVATGFSHVAGSWMPQFALRDDTRGLIVYQSVGNGDYAARGVSKSGSTLTVDGSATSTVTGLTASVSSLTSFARLSGGLLYCCAVEGAARIFEG